MADLSGVLGRIPGLGGYLAMRQLQQQEGQAELQQATGLMGLLSAAQQQQARQQAAQREQAAQAAMAGLPADATTADMLRVLRPHVSADKLLPLLQGEENKRMTVEANKEMTRSRLQQNAQNAEMVHQFRMQNLTRQQDRDAEIARHNRVKEAIDLEGLKLTGAKVFYDTGMGPGRNISIPGMNLVGNTPVPSETPQQNTQTITAPGLSAENLAAIEAIKNAGGGRVTLEEQFKNGPSVSLAGILASTGGQQQPFAGPAPVSPQQSAPAAFPSFSGYIPPQNPDTELRRVPVVPNATSPAMAPATTTNSSVPQIPPMPPEIAALPLRERAKWLQAQTKPSIAGGGQLTPEALKFTAQQYLAGDRQAVQGYARNATARIALQNAIVEEAAARGMGPEAVAAKIADFAGIMAGSRTVGQRAANISLAATEAQEMLAIVKEQSDKFSRTNFVPWNMALRAYETQTGSPEIAAFGASVNALVNVYARAINPTGVPTVSDKEHARAVLNTVQSPQQVEAVLGIINRELEIAKKAPRQVREATRAGIVGEERQSGDYSKLWKK